MKQAARNTWSATRLTKSERVVTVIKKEEDIKISLNQRKTASVASPDPNVKAEETDLNLKLQEVKAEEEKGLKSY